MKVKTPVFDSVNKPYDRYVQEIAYWKIVSKIDKKEQAVMLAYELPDSDPSGIRDKMLNELPLDKLNCEDGVANYIAYMDKIFKKDEQTQSYEFYVEFDTYKRRSDQKVTDFLMEFDKLYNMAAKRDMKLPATVLVFKLLDSAMLSKQDRMFVLTGINFDDKDTLYEQAKNALKKFTGEQVCSSRFTNKSPPISDIKVEPTFMLSNMDLVNPTAEIEQSLAAMGFYRRGNRNTRGGRGRGGGGYNGQRNSNQKYVSDGTNVRKNVEKPINPKNSTGELLTCISCGSYRHMLGECPHSYENMSKNKTHETLFVKTDVVDQVVDVVLYTGYGKEHVEDVSVLAYEASNKGVLDCGCSSTVAGEEWMNTFIDTLSSQDKASVVYGPGVKFFKFGGGEILKSLQTVEFPCNLAGTKVRMHSDIVSSDIPLLMSKTTMKKAAGVLDLVNDQVRFFGKWIPCDITSSGHYAVTLGNEEITVHDVMVTLTQMNSGDVQKSLLKLHRQFGHPRPERLSSFLKAANEWDSSYAAILKEIHSKCHTCRMFAKTPPRPVCALPIACEFGEILTMDLKECTLPGIRYILHMIDAYTRFSVSTFIPRKFTGLIVEKVLSRWVAIFGTPGRIWTDLGGEFNSDEMKAMGEALNVELGAAAGMAPWMNGLCERNHQIVDFFLRKFCLIILQ